MMPLPTETILHILFSADFNPKSRSAMMFALCGERNQGLFEQELWALKIAGSSLDFYTAYLKRLLDEFSFIQQLTWRRYWAPDELGDEPDSILEFIINGHAFEFYSASRDYLHPGHVPEKKSFSTSEFISDEQDWNRLIDGFILFNDIQFTFSHLSEQPDINSPFRIQELDPWYAEDIYVGMGELFEFKLQRQPNGFICYSDDYEPPPPLPPK